MLAILNKRGSTSEPKIILYVLTQVGLPSFDSGKVELHNRFSFKHRFHPLVHALSDQLVAVSLEQVIDCISHSVQYTRHLTSVMWVTVGQQPHLINFFMHLSTSRGFFIAMKTFMACSKALAKILFSSRLPLLTYLAVDMLQAQPKAYSIGLAFMVNAYSLPS